MKDNKLLEYIILGSQDGYGVFEIEELCKVYKKPLSEKTMKNKLKKFEKQNLITIKFTDETTYCIIPNPKIKRKVLLQKSNFYPILTLVSIMIVAFLFGFFATYLYYTVIF